MIIAFNVMFHCYACNIILQKTCEEVLLIVTENLKNKCKKFDAIKFVKEY